MLKRDRWESRRPIFLSILIKLCLYDLSGQWFGSLMLAFNPSQADHFRILWCWWWILDALVSYDWSFGASLGLCHFENGYCTYGSHWWDGWWTHSADLRGLDCCRSIRRVVSWTRVLWSFLSREIQVEIVDTKVLYTLYIESIFQRSLWYSFYILLRFEEILRRISATIQLLLTQFSQLPIFQILLSISNILVLHECALPASWLVSHMSILSSTHFGQVFYYILDLLLWQVAKNRLMFFLQGFWLNLLFGFTSWIS